MATPNSRAVFRSPICSDSMSRLKGEYLYVWSVTSRTFIPSEGSYVLDLDGVDVLDLASTSQRLGAALGQTDVLDLTLVLELLHLLDGLLDRGHLVQAVAVVEIDVRETETSQRFLTGLAGVLGARVHVA
jgi:hypothetical protein